uniref:Centriolar satellite-associated tubulin polyglutamylase complex regulator 1 n=1 Tax=Anas platyrhynchos platyrhynchos TaxID=8840 RepID=A0A493T5V0_ANAPP
MQYHYLKVTCISFLAPEFLTLRISRHIFSQRHVLTYMEDAVSQLLENREDISQYGIARFFTEYFNSVRQGTHILFREFSFVQATPHNRASFLRTFWRCFRTVGKNGGKYSSICCYLFGDPNYKICLVTIEKVKFK